MVFEMRQKDNEMHLLYQGNTKAEKFMNTKLMKSEHYLLLRC